MVTPNHASFRSPSESLFPDDRLIADKYRIDEKIAEGGMGVVYRARHLDLDQSVAIKVVRPDLAHSELVIARFLNEARAAARLRGLHVARVLDAGRLDDGLPYLVMEFLEGADLSALLTHEGPLQVSDAIDYVLQACQAVAEAHASGIIHRDLKPENLFLTAGADGAPVIKVLDFGISKQLSSGSRSLTNPSSGVGSPHYMAPEQMRSPESVDQRADIWSLGTVLYELLTGSPPFDGDTLPVICAQVLGQEPTPLGELRTDVSPELERVILKALEKDRELRYGSVAEFARALECVRGGSESAHAQSPASFVGDGPARLGLEPISRERGPSSGAPVCSVRIRPRSNSDATPAPRVRTIQIPGLRPSRAPLVATVVALAACAGFVSARWSELGTTATALSQRFDTVRAYVTDLSTVARQSSAVVAGAPRGAAAPAPSKLASDGGVPERKPAVKAATLRARDSNDGAN